jgi:hypothetical protein
LTHPTAVPESRPSRNTLRDPRINAFCDNLDEREFLAIGRFDIDNSQPRDIRCGRDYAIISLAGKG